FPFFRAILVLSHGEPPGLLLCGASILPQVRFGSFSLSSVLFHFTVNPYKKHKQSVKISLDN
ncbi:MAG: hypothetical protein IKC28_11790, partial [Clostridia bacterium]|nr:hypothetical protein [Clostridia bacterium]